MSSAGCVVREATWRDLPALAAIEREVFAADAWSEATWWAELAARPRREYVVLSAPEGAVAGYAGLDHGGDTADVMTLAVVPEHRGEGLGDVLVGELLRRAGAVDAVLLEVRADNVSARKLYQRNGFEQIAVRRRYYQPGDVDAIVMRRLGGQRDG